MLQHPPASSPSDAVSSLDVLLEDHTRSAKDIAFGLKQRVEMLEAELIDAHHSLGVGAVERVQLRVDLGIWEAEALRRATAILEERRVISELQADNTSLQSVISAHDITGVGLRAELMQAKRAADDYSAALHQARRDQEELQARLECVDLDTRIARQNLQRSQSRIEQLERELVNRADREFRKSRSWRLRIARALGLAKPGPNDQLDAEVEVIADFIHQFDWLRLMAPDPAARAERIKAFLVTGADGLADLPFFSSTDYRGRYKGEVSEQENALLHFIRQGARQGWTLHPLIDAQYYYQRYPDVPALEMEAAVHYARVGAGKGYNPHPLFDTRFYLERYGDVAAAGINPLVHYLRFAGCDPHPLFDSGYYLSRHADVRVSGVSPLLHYLSVGAAEGSDPHPLFDTRFYLDTYPDVASAGINPLIHYVTVGASEGRWPNPRFNGAAYLRMHPEVAASGGNPLIHRIRNPVPAIPPAVLMIDAYYPRPDTDSGSQDQLSYIRIFRSLGFKVFFAADVELGVETKYRDALTELGVECVVYPDYVSVEAFLDKRGSELTLCFLSRVHFGARHIETIRSTCPDARIVFNTVDLHFVRERREAELRDDPAALARAEETRIAELTAAWRADATMVVSDHELELLREQVPKANLFMVPLIRSYETGRRTPYEARAGIGFIGSFRHAPNVDAVVYFLDEIWPLIRTKMPDAEFFIIGSDLPAEVAARHDAGVTCVGFVADLEAWLNRLRVTVAPLRYGAGAKGKVVSSLAYGVPCITTPIAAEGMGLRDHVHVEIGQSPKEFSDRVLRLYNDPVRWLALSDAGIALIRDRYSIGNGVEIFRSLLKSVQVISR